MSGKKAGSDFAPEVTTPKTKLQPTGNYNTVISQTQVYRVAVAWLFRGVRLVPIQPRSKCLVAGFGPYSQHITTEDAAWFWFQERACNLGLVTGGGLVILDFDQVKDYDAWRLAWPGLASTYTELTARGAHVFLAGESASGQLAGGVEVKGRGAVVMSAPSVHPGGVKYKPVNQEAVILPVPANFPLLSDSSKPLSKKSTLPLSGKDTIARIKAAFPVLDLAQTLTPLRSKDDRWWHGRCPFHDDKQASFWVDAQRGLWGCYACQVRGDIINLYAHSQGLSVNNAIAALAVAL